MVYYSARGLTRVRVLITGGTGFIGQHVAANLQRKGHSTLILDRHGGYSTEPNNTVLGDVRDVALVDAAVSDSDGVIHLAAVLGTQETINEPEIAAQVNIMGSLNVFEAIARYKLPAVYIAVGNYWMNNPYSISKTAAERFALMFNKERGTRIAVVRAYNAYGPGQKAAPVRKIIPNFILSALKDEEITVYGTGAQLMDMIYVEDVAEILVRALEHGPEPAVYEAGTGTGYPVKEIAKLVIELVGSGRIRHTEMRPGETENSKVVANPRTLRPLGHFNFLSLREGLMLTLPYYEQQVQSGGRV